MIGLLDGVAQKCRRSVLGNTVHDANDFRTLRAGE